MITLGYKEKYEKLLKNKKIYVFLTFLFLGLFVIDAVIFLILVSFENFNLAYFVNLPFCLVVSLCFAFFLAALSLSKKEIKFIQHIFNQYLNIITGSVVEISNETININGRDVLTVRLLDSKEELVLYYEINFGEMPFNEKDIVSLKVADNFILEYKVEEK